MNLKKHPKGSPQELTVTRVSTRRREKWGIIFGALYTGLAIVEGILGTH